MIDNILIKIQSQIKENIYHGASLSLYDGKWTRHYLGTLDGINPVKSDLIYDLASVSKVVGVGTIMIFLLQTGQVELDRPLKDYYPAFHSNQVTIRELLTHHSGINPFIANRDQLNAKELIEAINHITVSTDKPFLYTDINFILLGFLIEELYGQDLATIFQKEIFSPWQMPNTSFGPISQAVPTVKNVTDGYVHDPKARVLKEHAGSAGLFSNLADLEQFLEHYLQDEFAKQLDQNYSLGEKERSLAWDLQGDWLLHTGYTGTFILFNRKQHKAAIFLTNRTYEKDEREQWILDRNDLIAVIKDSL
ncbi:serine hydrolase domain-containing protein [Streptococcus sp. sy010]|uniref:serine hydrolase domain-containing protein n=1 Tax=Streptococcus sp. sy010 TaxID=2600148 RepID=UPI0011B5B2E2|nr:serine hydrolase domain-containing protein [Streptococcus sp. sy010]TWT16186.1 beta-lactamase family protein [Streptococcus sp. sy010]